MCADTRVGWRVCGWDGMSVSMGGHVWICDWCMAGSLGKPGVY